MKNKEILCHLKIQLNKLQDSYDKYLEITSLLQNNINIDEKNKTIHKINEEVVRLNNLYELVQECDQEGIDLDNDYYLVSQKELCGIYFSINYSEYCHNLYGHFYIEDDEWLYENFYSSHSELNTMINNLIVSNLAFNSDYGNCIQKNLSKINKFSTIQYMHDLLTTSNWKRDFLILTVQNTLNMLKNHYQDEEEVYVDVSSRSKLTIIESTEKDKEEAYK